ncbi:coproporphyrinogen III oxidase [Cryobacterium melibiosiphilum]|uniref:Heme chaperone HemW n=1 Tax=Cryobacterium melibiosiphilum TaxID=995039 RepID=A0A3A5MCJ3_9MICO|nr:radical SAM family heme chaperone HemW [Cryobacterium melibiosiphilum]RJT87202.1 coproporphyrinogen III oxidase [Cryobacterium melibiosiphilum]
MAGPHPLGDPAPLDGLLPASAAVDAGDREFSVYLHVPFCRVRCGYCDFNTYTATELRGVKQSDYASQAVLEVESAGRVLIESGVPARPVSTVFFGGGTPTLLPVGDLTRMLHAVRDQWGFVPGAEITTEANPDSVDAAYLQGLADAGFTRVSFGMQSAVPRVLATLERTHDPERVPLVVQWARDAGLDVSLDLIYGTPGETVADWRTSLEYAINQAPDHISTYSLIVEEGTKLARQIRRGDVAAIDDDTQAEFYELADELLGAAGFHWYEVSNWATDVSHESRHNLAYWRSHDWWGVGPGAHSHVGGVRWWNAKHPAAYAERVLAGHSPAVGRETLDAETREVERVLLLSRIRTGIPIASLTEHGRHEIAGLIADELVNARAAIHGDLELTLRGRLLADAVVRRILPD